MLLFDFNRAPFVVMWEVTRACGLDCAHGRADAIACRDPRELTTQEGFRLIDQVAALEPRAPVLDLTGGDPMRRPDLKDLVRYAADSGLIVALTPPGGTAAATRKRLAELQRAGLSRLAVSLDGPDAETHDACRRVRGSYACTMRIIEAAIDLQLPLQINTTIRRMTLPYLETMARRVAELPLILWAIFFLVQTSRGAGLDQVNDDEGERVLNYLYDLSLTSPFSVKTTDAPQYQRVIWQRDEERHLRGLPAHSVERLLRAPRSMNDGNGFIFVDQVGNICPSGYLQVPRGNVRTANLADVYRTDEVFTRLRNPDALLGKCRRCRFRAICGGSRSRAFAATGALMASDPLCVYDPGPNIQPIVAG